jgi:phosphoenolpyruvate carboxykinase (GTP)
MDDQHDRILSDALRDEDYGKLTAISNPELHRFVARAIELCRPESVFVSTDSPEDIAYLRNLALEQGEERALAIEGHTVHFDGYYDQARDKANTRYFVSPGSNLGANLNCIDKQKGLPEVLGFLKDSMVGRQMLVLFFCLGPTDSPFSLPAMQITDSAYVAHSDNLLFRSGYEQFRSMDESAPFFRILHSAGRLEEGVSADVGKRRVYIDLEEETVYSVNTQYAGNTVGFKKLCLRLAINRASREGWLAEHMFIMGAHGPDGRVTYFTGAFPSACGKTSTAMIAGETIVGDDLAYLRKIDGQMRVANVESGIFGIIRDVNPEDDPVIWEAITTPGEVIFSNVLVADDTPYWLGDGREPPKEGINFSGKWYEGKVDDPGEPIPHAHKNARYTVRLRDLSNVDERAGDPSGLPVGGIIYGGRDSDTWVPVQQALDWEHGVITMAASLESETTAATLGAEGVRAFQPMSNLDFVSLPLGVYIQSHLDFVKDLDYVPPIFAVNYFQRGSDGRYLTGMHAKNVWVKWMELRAHDDTDAILTPTGLVPLYADLKRLFHDVLGQDYAEQDYAEQFVLRIPENLQKIERIENIYRKQVADTPQVLFSVLEAQRQRLLEAQGTHGDYIDPRRL